MKIGIIGRTGAGRSTLFAGLTGQEGGARGGGRTRLGVARVLDPRVDALTAICKPRKTVYAEVTLAVPPAAPRGVVDAAVVGEMRDLRALVHVVGAYAAEDPAAAALAEMAELGEELVLGDMGRVEKRLARLKKGGEARPGERELLEEAAARLEREEPLRLGRWDERAQGLLGELGMVSQRPLLTVVNVAEARAADPLPEAVARAAEAGGGRALWLSAALEREIASLGDDPGAQAEFLEAYGLKEPLAPRFIKAAFDLLDQITFFTVGPDEVRAWPIPRHTPARRAARTIHTDLERGFIRAEVMDYDAFLQHKSEAACRAAGRLRVEGKDYEVKDGDIITVRFNV